MAFADQFPATTWAWRQLTSRWARRVYFSLAMAVLLITTALRVWAFTFEHRVNSIVAGLAQLQLDQTTKSEMLERVPALHPDSRAGRNCEVDECYSAKISNWVDGTAFRLFMTVGNEHTYRLLYWLGVRYWDFRCGVRLRKGKVFTLGYSLALDDGTFATPGILFLNVAGERGYNKDRLSPTTDESPDYRITPNRKWTLLGLRVEFTPGAASELVHHAFDVRLNCVWQLLGCRTARQLLPAAEADKQAIESAARARLSSENPCPDRILIGRARDVADILLVDVDRVRAQLEINEYQSYRMADYRLVEVLKGKADRPLKGVGHPLTIYTGIRSSDETVLNPALQLLRPGNRVLMFSDNSLNIDAPCEIMEATPSALQTIRMALMSPASQVAEADRQDR